MLASALGSGLMYAVKNAPEIYDKVKNIYDMYKNGEVKQTAKKLAIRAAKTASKDAIQHMKDIAESKKNRQMAKRKAKAQKKTNSQ